MLTTSRHVALHLREDGLRLGMDCCVPKTSVWAVEGWLCSVVCLCPQWQVLNKAKNHIQELEQNLDNLLKLKGNRPPSPLPLLPTGRLVGFSIENREIGLGQANTYLLRAYRVPTLGWGQGSKESHGPVLGDCAVWRDRRYQVPDPILRDHRGRRPLLVTLNSKGKSMAPFLGAPSGRGGCLGMWGSEAGGN